jgi:hypothetical protein
MNCFKVLSKYRTSFNRVNAYRNLVLAFKNLKTKKIFTLRIEKICTQIYQRLIKAQLITSNMSSLRKPDNLKILKKSKLIVNLSKKLLETNSS